MPNELLIAVNPDGGSSLGFLIRVPLGEGIVLRTSGTWPRTKALYCHPVPAGEWPAEPEIVERVPLRACSRRGASIDLVADRSRESRSQLVYTTARGRNVVFWQSPRTRKQARPAVGVPTARAAGIAELEIVVDAHERYPYRFANQQVRTTRRALACGDYGVAVDGALTAVVERKSVPDLLSSLQSGRLRFALGELAALPRAAVVVEDRFSQIFKQDFVRPAAAADGLAELQVRWPNVPIVFCETRPLAEEWTYRFLAAAHAWAAAEPAAIALTGGPVADPASGPAGGGGGSSSSSGGGGRGGRGGGRSPARSPSPAELRAWGRANGMAVPDRGRIPDAVGQAWDRWQSS